MMIIPNAIGGLGSVTDIINSRAEPHFKATGWVISEILIVNAANW